ncbi:hypothetical protein Tco_0473091 [Tanacetum coccineum]
MSNTNNTMQTQTSNALHNAIVETGGKDRPPMLAPGSSETHTKGFMETYKTVSEDIRKQLDAEAEAVQIILTGIYNDIYSRVDACPNACKMWKAIERLKQGKSINVQDQETNLFWEFGKFTLRDVETLESYYSRFYKMMNELVRNQCEVTNHQNEVNEIRAERLARTANLLALVAQQQSIYHSQNHPQNHPTHYTQNSSTRLQQAATRNRGKAIVNSPPPTYDQDSAMVAKDDEVPKENRANKDNTPRINRGIGYDNQRAFNVARVGENVGTQVVQQFGIQCYNCKEYRHAARECQKPKRAKDAAYHKEKMLLCKQEEVGFQLNAEQPLQKVQHDNNDYNMFANERIHHEQPESVNDTYLVEHSDSHKMSSKKSFNDYTQKINDLNLTISEMTKELIAHQESISIMSQAKEDQKKFYKTREDKELEKVIALENKIKVLDDIVYKTGQSVQTMNM